VKTHCRLNSWRHWLLQLPTTLLPCHFSSLRVATFWGFWSLWDFFHVSQRFKKFNKIFGQTARHKIFGTPAAAALLSSETLILWCFLALSDTHTCANTSCCNVYSCIICSLSGLLAIRYSI
jgi:hypothetical protein